MAARIGHFAGVLSNLVTKCCIMKHWTEAAPIFATFFGGAAKNFIGAELDG
jgi:hypothetical protein